MFNENFRNEHAHLISEPNVTQSLLDLDHVTMNLLGKDTMSVATSLD